MKTHEPAALRKFPRKTLQTRKNIFEHRFTKLSSITATLVLKLHAEGKIFSSRISKMIEMNEQNMQIYHGCQEYLIKKPVLFKLFQL